MKFLSLFILTFFALGFAKAEDVKIETDIPVEIKYPKEYKSGKIIKEIPKEFCGLWESKNQTFRRFLIENLNIHNIDMNKGTRSTESFKSIHKIDERMIILELENDSIRVLRLNEDKLNSNKFTNEKPVSSIPFSKIN